MGKRLRSARWEIFQRDYLRNLEPTPGARDLVQRMKDDGLKLIVATSASGDELGCAARRRRCRDLFEKHDIIE